jgi:hypothetical protein
MSGRAFSSSAKALLKWAGFSKDRLDPKWKNAVETFTAPGGKAEAVRYLFDLVSFRKQILVIPNIDVFVTTMNNLANRSLTEIGEIG